MRTYTACYAVCTHWQRCRPRHTHTNTHTHTHTYTYQSLTCSDNFLTPLATVRVGRTDIGFAWTLLDVFPLSCEHEELCKELCKHSVYVCVRCDRGSISPLGSRSAQARAAVSLCHSDSAVMEPGTATTGQTSAQLPLDLTIVLHPPPPIGGAEESENKQRKPQQPAKRQYTLKDYTETFAQALVHCTPHEWGLESCVVEVGGALSTATLRTGLL